MGARLIQGTGPKMIGTFDRIRAELEAEAIGVDATDAGSERAVIAGQSEGGALAMLFAAAHPERTAALIPVVFCACLLLLQVGGAGAQGTERQTAAMVQTVVDQLAAFRRGDWSAAYGYASSAIQAQFPLEAFRRMVTGGYPAIARSARGTVLRTEVLDPQRGFVEVRVEGQDGQTIDALYEVVEEQGAWRINGVLSRPVEPGSTAGRAARSRLVFTGPGTGAPRAGGAPGR